MNPSSQLSVLSTHSFKSAKYHFVLKSINGVRVLIPVKQSFSFHPSIHVQVLGEEHSIFVPHGRLQIAIAKQTDYTAAHMLNKSNMYVRVHAHGVFTESYEQESSKKY